MKELTVSRSLKKRSGEYLGPERSLERIGRFAFSSKRTHREGATLYWPMRFVRCIHDVTTSAPYVESQPERLTHGFPHFDNEEWRSVIMADQNPRRPWEERLHETGARIEEDVRDFVRYFNDEIVPDIRKNGSEALRAAARELNRLAQRMDERAGRTPPPGPKDAPKP
jgi:hypothetical protein